jgi:hypothetical protein
MYRGGDILRDYAKEPRCGPSNSGVFGRSGVRRDANSRIGLQIAAVSLMTLLAYILQLAGMLFLVVGLTAWLPFFREDMRLDLVGAIFFVALGAVLYLVGRWVENRIRPEKTKQFVLKPNDIGFILAMLKRQRRIYLSLGILFLAFDALIILAAIQGNEGQPPPSLISLVLGIAVVSLIGGLGLLGLYSGLILKHPTRSPIYKALTMTPHLITDLTVYFIQAENVPGKVGLQRQAELNVEGKKLRVVLTEEQSSLLKQYLQLHSPQASYHEKELKYHVRV